MTLTSHRQHKIYLAATMRYGLGSNDPEEIDYYNKIKSQILGTNKHTYIGIPRED